MAISAAAGRNHLGTFERTVPPEIEAIAARLVNLQQASENPVLGFSEVEIPSVIDVRDLVEDLREAIFPGLAGGERLQRTDAVRSLSSRLHHLHVRLSRVISVAKKLRKAALSNSSSERFESATRDSLDFLARLPSVRVALMDDAWAALEGDPAAASLEEIVLSYPGHFAISVYRLAHELWNLNVPYLPRMMAELAHRTTGIDIHPAASIGARFFIDHGTGVVIGETTKIGDRVRLYQGVTLGAHSPRRQGEPELKRADKRHPTLEDDVIVYAGATILGGSTIVGKGAIIGGSSWVVESVPPGAEVTVDVEIKVSSSRARPSSGPQM
ncbi:MAG TPA: serine O-acetyltransferase EpsC [Polyangiaceae bacterium]|nr:serine O-acetyltransferase EpsC [Polyangiaceae bacterium]